MSTACGQRGVIDGGTPGVESGGLGGRRGPTYHGDARGVLVLFRDDAHQSGSQQQENEGILELGKQTKKIIKPNCNIELNTELLKLSWPRISSERIRLSLLVTAASLCLDRAGAAPEVGLTPDLAPMRGTDGGGGTDGGRGTDGRGRGHTKRHEFPLCSRKSCLCRHAGQG